MKIIPSSASSYAYIVLDDQDKLHIQEIEKGPVNIEPKWKSLRGLRIEVSKDGQVPEELKPKLVDGKFLVIE